MLEKVFDLFGSRFRIAAGSQVAAPSAISDVVSPLTAGNGQHDYPEPDVTVGAAGVDPQQRHREPLRAIEPDETPAPRLQCHGQQVQGPFRRSAAPARPPTQDVSLNLDAQGARLAHNLPAFHDRSGGPRAHQRQQRGGTCIEAMAKPQGSRSLPAVHEGWPLPAAAPHGSTAPWPTTRPWHARTRSRLRTRAAYPSACAASLPLIATTTSAMCASSAAAIAAPPGKANHSSPPQTAR